MPGRGLGGPEFWVELERPFRFPPFVSLKRLLPASILVLSCLNAAAADSTGDRAALPYRTISKLFQGVRDTPEKDRLNLPIRVTPRDSSDKAPLHLVIKAKSGDVPLEVAADGELLRFPLTPALQEENPRIEADRPKGSLQLGLNLSLRRPGTASDETAAWYQKALDQANAAARTLAGGHGLSLSKAKSLLVEFPAGSKGRVTLRSGGKDTVLDADSNDTVSLAISKQGAETRILFSPDPVAIRPD